MDIVVYRLVIANQIDLIHGDDHVLDPQQRRDVQVALGLFHHAIAGIDEQDDDFRRGHACDRISGVLHVTWGIRKDETALVSGEIPVGDVNGNALFAFGAQAVDKQRKIQTIEAAFRRGRCHGFQLVRQHRLGVMQQTPHECGLAVVHRTSGADAQRAAVVQDGCGGCGGCGASHQK